MHFLASTWGYFLVATFIFYLATAVLQLRNIQRIASSDLPLDRVVRRFAPVIIFGLSGFLAGVLFIIGVIANLMGH